MYVVAAPEAELDSALGALRAAGYEAEPFAALRQAEPTALPEVRSQDLASVFFTSGTTGLSKGVMMPHAHMHLFADETVSLTRLTEDDTYLSMGPLFHGNSQFLAAYPSLIAGARYVMRERFSASRWAEWVRDSRATVTNFVGVMMDFVWKSACLGHRRRQRPALHLRCADRDLRRRSSRSGSASRPSSRCSA